MSKPSNFHIIIIDDNQEIHKDFIKILTSNSSERNELDEREKKIFDNTYTEKSTLPEFIIDTAYQGMEGVERIKNALIEGNPYSLAFVDIRMPPGWDGIETIKRIWQIDPDIQIVICTAYSDYSWEETVEQLGQRENLLILKKPFDYIAVRQLTCALTKKWQMLQDARDYAKMLEEKIDERTNSLQKSLSITRGTLESTTDGILVLDSENNIIDYNQKFIEIWKITDGILELKDSNIIFEYISMKLDNSDGYLSKVKKVIDQSDAVEIDNLKCKDGRIIDSHSQPYKLNNKISGRIWSFRDITQRALLDEKIKHQATHDALTDLPNRVLLSDRIRREITKSNRENKMFGVLFFDLDRFKLINDSFSHSAGDELLQAVAKRLQFSMREMDTLARLGGDEFVGVVTSLTDEKQLVKIANKLLDEFTTPFTITNRQINVSTSIGISVFPRDGSNVDEILRNADTAMYRAKELGGKQAHFYTAELSNQGIARLEAEADLSKAIKNNELFLCYQPEYNITTGSLVSAEALIRWQHPTKGLILPIEFIPLAEETGLIIPIGEWVIRTACRENKRWQSSGLPPIRIGVNLTTFQIRQPNFVSTVKQILEETDLKPEYLEFELTENVIINGMESLHAISELKELGVSFALDDFGTGFSSINYLRKIPLDKLKIDKSFIKNINKDRSDEILIQAIIAMAQNMNLEILAEGVETQTQLDFLKLNDCRIAQGHLFSKPLSSNDLEALLKNTPILKKELA